jgi:hypothetical protein
MTKFLPLTDPEAAKGAKSLVNFGKNLTGATGPTIKMISHGGLVATGALAPEKTGARLERGFRS